MHRTTVEFDERLLRNLKEICVKEKKTFKGLVLELVRAGLAVCHGGKKKRVQAAVSPLSRWVTSKNPLPRGIDPSDRSTYWHALQRSMP